MDKMRNRLWRTYSLLSLSMAVVNLFVVPLTWAGFILGVGNVITAFVLVRLAEAMTATPYAVVRQAMQEARRPYLVEDDD